MLPLKNLLQTYLDHETDWKLSLIKNWPEIIGSLGSKISLEKVHEDTIVLAVYDSCWMQELYLLSPVLIASINKKLDQPRIKQVRFKQAGKKKEKQAAAPIKPIKPQREITLSSREITALNDVKDPSLREALKAFRIRCYRENS